MLLPRLREVVRWLRVIRQGVLRWRTGLVAHASPRIAIELITRDNLRSRAESVIHAGRGQRIELITRNSLRLGGKLIVHARLSRVDVRLMGVHRRRVTIWCEWWAHLLHLWDILRVWRNESDMAAVWCCNWRRIALLMLSLLIASKMMLLQNLVVDGGLHLSYRRLLLRVLFRRNRDWSFRVLLLLCGLLGRTRSESFSILLLLLLMLLLWGLLS